MELADVLDSKSSGSDTVRVRPPLPAPKKRTQDSNREFVFCYADRIDQRKPVPIEKTRENPTMKSED